MDFTLTGAEVADFENCQFNSLAKFQANFKEVYFKNVKFNSKVDFSQTQFDSIASFSGAQFTSEILFNSAIST